MTSKPGQDSIVSVAHTHIPNINKQSDYGHQDIILTNYDVKEDHTR